MNKFTNCLVQGKKYEIETLKYIDCDSYNFSQGNFKDWDIEKMSGLNDVAEKARDYVANLPTRLEKLADRVKIPELAYPFTWIVQ